LKLSDSEFQRIVSYVKSNYGIVLDQKRVLIEGRLENYLVKHDYKSYHEYMGLVESNPRGNEAANLINVLTTNHTYFMRESEHFSYLRQVVLPWIRKKAGSTRDVRIWCAASSTGEEPYTIAMVIADYFGLEHGSWDTQVLATDISTDVLRRAMEGIYTSEQVEVLPDNWRRRFFRKIINEDAYRVTDELKREVIYRKFNLMDEFPFRKKLHVVFLRNVMIYFDEKTKRELIQKVYDAMEPGGYLFIGQTESIAKEYCPFEHVRPSVYRKRERK